MDGEVAGGLFVAFGAVLEVAEVGNGAGEFVLLWGGGEFVGLERGRGGRAREKGGYFEVSCFFGFLLELFLDRG